MRPASLAGSHEALRLASAAFSHRIELSRWTSRRSRTIPAEYIVAKHAVDSELALIDGAVRTLERGLDAPRRGYRSSRNPASAGATL